MSSIRSILKEVKNWSERKMFWVKTGTRMELENDGKPVDELVIRYKDFFFNIMIDCETGEPTGSFGWTQGTPITHTPVRDFYIATRESDNENH
jgi:hypothetical protein